MGAKLSGTYYDEANTQWDVTIDQDGYAGSTTDMDLRDLEIKWQSDGEELWSPIITSSARIVISVPDSSTEGILTGMASSAEGEFTVKIEKAGSLYWAGLVMMDLANVQYANYPFDFTIDATDGIGRLKDIDYNDAGTAYEGKETFHEHLFNILGKIPTSDHWGASDVYLRSLCYWWDTYQTGAYPYNSWDYARFDHRAVRKNEDNGEFSYQSCYDVLREMCQNWFCRIMLTDGAFTLIQVPLYNYTGIVGIRQRTKTNGAALTDVHTNWNGWKTDLGTSAERIATTVDGTMETGAIERYRAPLRAVRVRYNHFSTQNLFEGVEWDSTSATLTTNGPVDDNGGEARILMQFGITYRLAYTTQIYFQSGWMLFSWTIYVEESDGTKHYLKQDASIDNGFPVYGEAEWTTTVSNYQVYTDMLGISGFQYYQDWQFITPPLDASGDLSINVGYLRYEDINGDTILNSGNDAHTVTWDIQANNVEVLYSGNPEDRVNFRLATAVNTADSNSREIKLETYLGDGPTLSTFGAIEVKDPLGSAQWEQSTEWTTWADLVAGGTVPYFDRSQLLAREIMSLHQLAIYQLHGSMITDGDFEAHHIVEDGGRRMIMLSGSFNVMRRSWNGVWAQISYDKTNVSTPAPTDSFGNPEPTLPPPRYTPGVQPLQGGIRNTSGTVPTAADAIAMSQGIYGSTEGFASGDTIDEITVQTLYPGIRSTGPTLYENDQIIITNPTTGLSQGLALDGDLLSGGSGTIPIDDESALSAFPANSLITLDPAYLIRILGAMRNIAVPLQLIDADTDISGNVSQFNSFFRVPYWGGYRLVGFFSGPCDEGTSAGGNAGSYDIDVTYETPSGSSTTTVSDTNISFSSRYAYQAWTAGFDVQAGGKFTIALSNFSETGSPTRPKGLMLNLIFLVKFP